MDQSPGAGQCVAAVFQFAVPHRPRMNHVRPDFGSRRSIDDGASSKQGEMILLPAGRKIGRAIGRASGRPASFRCQPYREGHQNNNGHDKSG